MLNSLLSSTDKKSNKLQISNKMECCVIVHVCYVSCARFLVFGRVQSNLISNISMKFFSQNAAMFLVTSLQPSRFHRSREYSFDELFERVSLGGVRERGRMFIVFALFPCKTFPSETRLANSQLRGNGSLHKQTLQLVVLHFNPFLDFLNDTLFNVCDMALTEEDTNVIVLYILPSIFVLQYHFCLILFRHLLC